MVSRIRVLLAKPGLDGHDKGVKVVARALMEAGMEVVYLGLRQSPEHIAQATVQEDPDVVGLSILSGAHVSMTRKVVSKLKEAGCSDIPVVVGGTIPPRDVDRLRDAGATAVFPMGTDFEEIISWIEEHVYERFPRPDSTGSAR
jgi:methylmalonyl-CoA mutase C-terminal domain/subunit